MKSYFPYIFLIVFWACSNPNFYHVKSEQNDKKPLTEDEKYERYYDSVYPSLLIYGGLPEPKDRQRQIVDEWYKFRFIVMSYQCNNPAPNSTYEHNLKTDHVMSERFGYNWYQKFENSVDSLYAIDSFAEKIAISDSRIQRWLQIHDSYNPQYQFYPNIEFHSHSTLHDDIKMVIFSGYAFISKSVQRINMLRATVNLRKSKVVNIDSTAFAFF